MVDGALQIPEYFNIAKACTEPRVCGLSPDQTAIIVDQGGADTTTLSYAELAQQSIRFAHALSGFGIAAKDRVMLWLPNGIEFPIAFFGILRVGAIAVPSSMLLTGEEIDYLASDSGARILVTTTTLWQKLHAHQEHSHNLEQVILVDDQQAAVAANIPQANFQALLETQPGNDFCYPTRAEDPAYLVYTSGTTGYPKGVLHAHRALIGRSPSAHYWFSYHQTGDRILHSGKFNWTYVLGTALMDPLYLGKTVVVYEGESNTDTWPTLIAKHRCTIFIGVPTVYRQIIQKTAFSAQDVPTLRHCMCAGEHLSNEILSAWKQRFEQDIYEAIGMSECSYYLSQHPGRTIRPGSAGFPQPGHLIALLDDDMQPVADEQEGMLCINLQDAGLFLGYWNLPHITQQSRRQGYFLTGDYARRDKDGYIWFLGRKDDIINSFGFRISPHEIERVIKTHPQVADCVALEKQVAQDKNIVVACVIAQAGQTIEAKELIVFSAAHLATYKIPKEVHVMADFPRTANGKILRKELKKFLS